MASAALLFLLLLLLVLLLFLSRECVERQQVGGKGEGLRHTQQSTSCMGCFMDLLLSPTKNVHRTLKNDKVWRDVDLDEGESKRERYVV